MIHWRVETMVFAAPREIPSGVGNATAPGSHEAHFRTFSSLPGLLLEARHALVDAGAVTE